MKTFRRVEKIIQAKQQTAMEFLLEHEKATIDGKRASDPRLGWVICENGSEIWVSAEEFRRDYVPVDE